jgi:hypothetical protein
MSVTSPPESYNIDNICLQIKRRGLLNVPPPRYTPVSPYPQYTQFQLNMRRKAEILKYKANGATNTKQNNFTKAELYSMLVQGVSPQQYSQQTLIDISNGLIQCNNTIVQTPTSSCDVPGPVINLYLDPTIPLYNYATNNRNYGIINSVDNSLWTTYTSNDLFFLLNIITELFTLYIHNNVTQNYYNYVFETPVAISITGGPFVLNPVDPNDTTEITITIENVYLYVYFNSTLITSNNPNTTPTIQNVPIVMNDFIPLTLNVSNINANFGAVFFCGLLQVSNMLLFTQPGFIYDIQLQFGLSVSDNNFSNIQVGAVCNVSTYNNNFYNCTLLTTPSTDTNSGFIFGT